MSCHKAKIQSGNIGITVQTTLCMFRTKKKISKKKGICCTQSGSAADLPRTRLALCRQLEKTSSLLLRGHYVLPTLGRGPVRGSDGWLCLHSLYTVHYKCTVIQMLFTVTVYYVQQLYMLPYTASVCYKLYDVMTQSLLHKAAAALIALLYIVHCHCEKYTVYKICRHSHPSDPLTEKLGSKVPSELLVPLFTWLLGISRHSISKCKTYKWNVFVRTMKCKKKQEQEKRGKILRRAGSNCEKLNWTHSHPFKTIQSRFPLSRGERNLSLSIRNQKSRKLLSEKKPNPFVTCDRFGCCFIVSKSNPMDSYAVVFDLIHAFLFQPCYQRV